MAVAHIIFSNCLLDFIILNCVCARTYIHIPVPVYVYIHACMVARASQGRAAPKKFCLQHPPHRLGLGHPPSLSWQPPGTSATELWTTEMMCRAKAGKAFSPQRFPPRPEDGCSMAPAFLFRCTGLVYFSPVPSNSCSSLPLLSLLLLSSSQVP